MIKFKANKKAELWNGMSTADRETFLLLQGAHKMFIDRTIGKKYDRLPVGIQNAIKSK